MPGLSLDGSEFHMSSQGGRDEAFADCMPVLWNERSALNCEGDIVSMDRSGERPVNVLGGLVSAGSESKYLRKGIGRPLSLPNTLQLSSQGFRRRALRRFAPKPSQASGARLPPSSSSPTTERSSKSPSIHESALVSASAHALHKASQSSSRTICRTSSGGIPGDLGAEPATLLAPTALPPALPRALPRALPMTLLRALPRPLQPGT
mmetsp:Transcript_29878/g.86843  ORF Transcript_29878/g.86843 Transcript_29878/m.86843 type:complete len:207 (-) Transcript_29878:103-723(-)